MTQAAEMLATREIAVDTIVESAFWTSEHGAEAAVRRAIAVAAEETSTGGAEVAIVLTDDSTIRSLNREWRGIDKPTNVLSFPARAVAGQYRGAGDAPRHLGDIVVAYETVAQEAAAAGTPLLHHLSHLAVHGFLHLIGYDHTRDQDADRMEAIEVEILARLGIADPYRLEDAGT
jgi:probable rRNA maturation factor